MRCRSYEKRDGPGFENCRRGSDRGMKGSALLRVDDHVAASFPDSSTFRPTATLGAGSVSVPLFAESPSSTSKNNRYSRRLLFASSIAIISGYGLRLRFVSSIVAATWPVRFDLTR